MIKQFLKFFLLSAFTCSIALSQEIPEKPNQQRLVNDFANILSESEISSLESQLLNFEKETSNQIIVVTVKSLNGLEKSEFAYSLGEKWGVGQKDFNNGIIILVKPKYDEERGQAFIATGYGLEGAVPDATAKNIVEIEMISEFKQDKYFKGIQNAVNTLISLTKGEYTAEEYDKTNSSSNLSFIIIIIFVMVSIIISMFKKGKGKGNGGSSGSSGRGMWYGGTGGSWGSFSSGGGSFGGFGGGSFGGGGAGGSW